MYQLINYLTILLLSISACICTTVVANDATAIGNTPSLMVAPSSPVDHTQVFSKYVSGSPSKMSEYMSKSDDVMKSKISQSYSTKDVQSMSNDKMTPSLTESVAMETKMQKSAEMSVKLTQTVAIAPSTSMHMKVTPTLPPTFEKECVNNCKTVCCSDTEIESFFYNETLSCDKLTDMQCEYAKTLHKCETKLECSTCKTCSGKSLIASVVLIFVALLISSRV